MFFSNPCLPGELNGYMGGWESAWEVGCLPGESGADIGFLLVESGHARGVGCLPAESHDCLGSWASA